MPSPIFKMMTNNTDTLYSDRLVHHRVEDHLKLLKDTATTKILDDYQRHRFENDFFNLLSLLGVPSYAYYATMRINDLTHPNQYLVGVEEILLPNLENLRWVHDIHHLYKRYSA